MLKTLGLCFTSEGLGNPDTIPRISATPDIENITVIVDGSDDAMDHLIHFSKTLDDVLPHNKNYKWGIMITPSHGIQYIGEKGLLTKPQYTYSQDLADKFICSKVIAPLFKVSLSAVSNTSSTEMILDRLMVENVTYHSYKLWLDLEQAESFLGFPALAINQLIPHSYFLTKGTMDIDRLRILSGLGSKLDYNSLTNLLELTINDDVFHVSVDILNHLIGKAILPKFNLLRGRRFILKVEILSLASTQPIVISSYGELGMHVSMFRSQVKETIYHRRNPMPSEDLLQLIRKNQSRNDGCIWLPKDVSLENGIQVHRENMVPGNNYLDTSDHRHIERSLTIHGTDDIVTS